MSTELIIIAILAFMVMGGGIALLVLAWKMFQRGSQLYHKAERKVVQTGEESEDAAFIKDQSRSISNELFQLSEKALDAALRRDAYITTQTDSIMKELREVKRQVGRESEQASSYSDRSLEGRSVVHSSQSMPSEPDGENGKTVQTEQETEVSDISPAEELVLLSLYRIIQLRKEEHIPLQQIHIVASRNPDRTEQLQVQDVRSALDQLARRGLVEVEDQGSSEPEYGLTNNGERTGAELDSVRAM